ncbi:tail fiber domain-containing protein [Lacibacter sediminis]|uniref:Tail fiber domain-containing protein n=1 Tax=Lacibacter sediminis TaxID=2760713 RepID=A0A7G5XCK7_9BACT|nr:tail fiber domain-containing protein [Lacibacter sediminis]QNA43210.1 tail fiber domain-containing protein [Lacibacter sediminis]
MKKLLFSLICIPVASILYGQSLGINADGSDPDSSAILDVKSTNKGVLIPRMNQSQRNAIVLPAIGLIVYQTDNTPGFYNYNGSVWTAVSPTTNNLWNINGNAGITSANFIGTTDNQPLVFKVNNTQVGKFSNVGGNVLLGYNSGTMITSGTNNTALGNSALYSNTEGHHNVAIGINSLFTNNIGAANIAIGPDALYSNTTGQVNIAIGRASLRNNTNGQFNTAVGYEALTNNISGYSNTAMGNRALINNQFGTFNTAVGDAALNANVNGYGNTAMGNNSLLNTNSIGNAGFGGASLYQNTTGSQNTGVGERSLQSNITGSLNTGLGSLADVGIDGIYNATAVGQSAKVDCSNCLVLGAISGENYWWGDDVRVGIGTTLPNSNAALEIKSSNRGVLLPRLTLLQRNAIVSPSSGLLIYQTDNTPGFYYHNGNAWTGVSTPTNNLWNVNGNAGTTASNFIGTTDIQPLIFKFNNEVAGQLNNTNNTAFGRGALLNNTSSGSNTAFGINALRLNTTGQGNTATGAGALNQNTTGTQNTAIGSGSLTNNTTGNANTATGAGTLVLNTTGFGNTANGINSLLNNTTGNQNTGYGGGAINFTTSGNDNTGLGYGSLTTNTTGSQNTGVGSGANVLTANLSNATAIGAKARVDCDNCLVLGSVNGINGSTSDVKVGIGTTNPSASAVLDISSTDKGVLIPRMTLAQRNAITSPATSLLIYQTDNTPGYYYYNGTVWASITTNTNNLWSVDGNTGTNPSTNFIGTVDNQPLVFKINNQTAGFLRSDGNVAFGLNALVLNTNGIHNTGMGWMALNHNTTGFNNTASGTEALTNNTTGSNNTAIGMGSLTTNNTGSSNTATGAYALQFNTSSGNTATGFRSLWKNTNGYANTSTGNEALANNTTGFVNTAHGNAALTNNSEGYFNSAFGSSALASNTTGYANTAFGNGALSNNTTGYTNTVIGNYANVSSGDLNNATAIGNNAIVDANNKVRIGNSNVTVIEGQVPFTTPSDGRYKFNVREDVGGLNFILKLRPVTYQFDTRKFDADIYPAGFRNTNYNSANESITIRRTGFIAQEVEKAATETGYNFSGIIKPKSSNDHYGLSYESFVVPLVKAIQEQQLQISELKKENDELKKLKEQVETLSKIVQQLSAKKQK